jgi:hypothetical protein
MVIMISFEWSTNADPCCHVLETIQMNNVSYLEEINESRYPEAERAERVFI